MTNESCQCEKYIKLIEHLYKRKDMISARIRSSEERLKEAMGNFSADDIDMVDILMWAEELEILGKEFYLINSSLAVIGLGAYARVAEV